MSLTRKDVLAGGAAAALAAALAGRVQASTAPLNGRIVRNLPSADTVWAWEEQLGRWAPCFTGNANHQKWTDWLGAQLEMAGIEVRKKSFGIPLWDPKKWTLTLNGTTDVPVTSYRPYSGPTGPEGVTAPMAYAGKTGAVDWSTVAGKIALIDTPAPSGKRDDGGEDRSVPMYTVKMADANAARAAGAVGCVYIWNGVSDADAQDQALPFGGAPVVTPCLWVGERTGARLKAEAAKGSTLTLTMYAQITPHATSDNVWGILPGMTDEVFICNTHNDGCNAIEENGGLAVVALARALARIPKERRRKTYVFFTSTGHFAHGYHRGSTDWMRENPDILKRTVACLTMEHLGGTEWTDDATGVYGPTGRIQEAGCYVPTGPMHAVFKQAMADAGADRMAAREGVFYFPGEGSQFSAAGIPSIAYITAPDYLMTAPVGGEVGRLSKTRLYREIQTFARCLEQLDGMTREEAYQGMEALAKAVRPTAPRPSEPPPLTMPK